MKIITYNLNGIRAAVKNGLIDFISLTNADIYCFQETRATCDQVLESLYKLKELGYKIYCKESIRKGYSGIAIITKKKKKNEIKLIEEDEEARFLGLNFGDFSVYTLYVPNGDSGNSRLEYKFKFLDWATKFFKKNIDNGENFIIGTDFNISYAPIDVSNVFSCSKSSGYLPEERELFSRFLEVGIADSYRVIYPHNQRYTWSSYRAKRFENQLGLRYTFDYIFINNEMRNRVKDAGVLLEAKCSDHYPVYLII